MTFFKKTKGSKHPAMMAAQFARARVLAARLRRQATGLRRHHPSHTGWHPSTGLTTMHKQRRAAGGSLRFFR
ncbi:hypothetical protein HYS54_01900 [Candidatus Micrarchaeota archaeon]|nr:hypothetical protein [Candidatus Micrarchaeota archaeon]